jgi:hypothetical protein
LEWGEIRDQTVMLIGYFIAIFSLIIGLKEKPPVVVYLKRGNQRTGLPPPVQKTNKKWIYYIVIICCAIALPLSIWKVHNDHIGTTTLTQEVSKLHEDNYQAHTDYTNL